MIKIWGDEIKAALRIIRTDFILVRRGKKTFSERQKRELLQLHGLLERNMEFVK